MRRTLSLVLLATVIALVPALPASAGGNWLEFREDPRAGASHDGSSAGAGTLGTWAVLHVGQRVVAATGVYATDPPASGERGAVLRLVDPRGLVPR